MESTTGLQWAFSHKKQSAYATANPNVDINQSHPFEGADFADHTPLMSDNAAQYGKGHEFATRNALLSWDVRFKRTFQATTKMLGYAFAFHCGKVTTTTPAAGAYQHVFEYQDPNGSGHYGSGRQQPVTSIVERVTSGLIRKWPSVQVMAVEVTGQINDWIKMSVDFIGSGKRIDGTGFTFPTSTEGELLRTASLQFEHGPSGSLADTSCDVNSFRFRTEMAYDEVGGYCPGSGYQVSGDPTSGQVRNKLEFTRRAVMLEFVVRAKSDSTVLDKLEAQDDLEAVLTMEGGEIGVSGQNHTFIVTIPRLNYKAAPIQTDGDVIVFAVSAIVFYDAGLANPFEITVINDTAAYLVSS